MDTPKWTEAEARDARKPRKRPANGRHRFTVLEVTEGVSDKGNQTLRAVLGKVDPDGTEYRLVDVMSATKLGTYHLRRFCCACSCETEFMAGHVDPSMMIGKEVMGTVTTERGKGGFGPRAVISDYTPGPAAVVTPPHAAG